MKPHSRTVAGVRLLAMLVCVCGAPTPAEARQDVHEKAAVVALSDLPAEARETLSLIRRGGPFPHARDGIVFGNREGLLPHARKGSYREYTVPTPGRRDRGARRIIGSATGEFYYTADHYRSFRRILE
jgi:ribonuclease T1